MAAQSRAGLLALLLLFGSRLQAQFPYDTATADTIPTDTVDYTARFLQEKTQESIRLPVLPPAGNQEPRPSLTRVVFTRDSIEWGHAATVGDLLSLLPGVYLWRGGYIGRPEPVNFQGRGAGSAEYYLDGVPYVALGVDSIGVDPALFSISFLDRIEVERLPGRLRVWLYTRRHDRLAPLTRIAIARGDRNFARYEGELERRYESGVGFAAAADYLSSPTASGSSSGYSNTQAWLQGGYVPSDQFGVQYQLVRSGPNRRAFVSSDPILNDTIGRGFKATRTDAQFRAQLRRRGEGLGPSLDLIYARSAWDGAGLHQQVNQIGGYANYRGATYSLGGSAFHRSRWTSLDLRGNAGWTPVPQIALSAEVVHQSHDGDRKSDYLSLTGGVAPVRGLSFTGTMRRGQLVDAPSVLTDPPQTLRDYRVTAGWEGERLGLLVEWARTSAFTPSPYAEFLDIASLGGSPEIEWLTLGVRLAPVRWVTLESWYSDPRTGSAEGIPPTHSLSAVTLRSKFLRKFRSGIFDLKLRLSMESWGTGIIGRDPTGTPITLGGATFFRSLVELQLQSFTLYWDRGNLSASKLTYVPGFRIPAYGSNFGVRWEFLN